MIRIEIDGLQKSANREFETMNLNDNNHCASTVYQITPGQTRFAARRLESYRSNNGQIKRSARPSAASSFNPASPFDGQALAGTGALVFEGELLRN